MKCKNLLTLIFVMFLMVLTTISASVKEPPTIDMRDEVVLEDLEDGNEFVFSGCEDWMVNDYASVLMSDSGTPLDRTDDIIICAHYVGYKEVM